MKKKSLILPAIAIMLIIGACKKESDTRGIVLNLSYKPEQATDFLFMDVNYDFEITESFSSLPPDYNLFVHFWRIKNKQMLLQDDHEPEKTISSWQKGDSFSYSRRIFIPQFMNEFDIDFKGYEDIQFTVGLYRPGMPGDTKIILERRKIRFEPASFVAPEMIYDQGWYDLEIDPASLDPFRNSWRWTSRQASCFMENTRQESLLIIEGAVNKNIYDDQKVILKINDHVFDEFIPKQAFFKNEYTLNPEMMGENDEFYLTIETDKTFIPSSVDPASVDNRELGMQIFFLYFRVIEK